MKQLIMQDEKEMCITVLKKHFGSLKKRFGNLYFIGDCNFVCDYLLDAVQALNNAKNTYTSVTYISTLTETDYRKKTLENVSSVVDIISLDKINDNSVVFFFIDCVKGLKNKEVISNAFKKITELMRKVKNSKCVVSVLLPHFDAFSNQIEKLAEREFNFYLEKECERTPEIEYYLETEKMCRNVVSEHDLNVVITRFDNVFAPDIAHMPSFDLFGIIKDCYNKKKVTVTDQDLSFSYTLTYIRSACHAVFFSALKARKGNIYNVATNSARIEKIKKLIYLANPDVYALNIDISANVISSYNGLGTLKYKKLGIRTPSYLETGISHAVAYLTNEEYDTTDNVSFYNGKIKHIQALEVKLLQEIDRICKKHDIQYFLAGGTLLGAVRAGASIEWDDDLDIGMLRDDYEKFRKVCESELSPQFCYTSSFNKSGSHYTIDKVRLNDTFFSTNFSNKNRFPDGIFVDILVYDKTSNIKLFQKLHSFVLTSLTRLMEIKWFNKPRKNYHYRFTKFMLPFLRIIPWCVFNKIFDVSAKRYRKKKNAKWLIDSVGKKVNSDPLPNEGLDKVVYVDFEGINAPIPKNPVPYLTYAYGPDYMKKPPLSKRCCPHGFARIDLGKYVFDINETKPFRKVDVRGELFESEEEL